MMDQTTTFRVTPRFVIGLTVSWVGTFWLLDELGYHWVHSVLDLWPVGIILLAVVIALNGAGWMSTLFVAGIGIWLLGENLDWLDLDIGDLWPLILVIIGVRLIMKGAGIRPGATRTGRSSTVAIFGDRKQLIEGTDFSSADATAVLGSSTMDLTGATFPDGARIEVFCLAGGVHLIVSPQTRVVSDVVPIMAGYEDKRTTRTVPTQTLNLKGLCVWGGVEVTSAAPETKESDHE